MKNKQCGCGNQSETVKDVIEVLEREVSGYSSEHEPERITRLKAYIKKLNTTCGP